MKRGQFYYWVCKEFGRVKLIRPFQPPGLLHAEWVCETEQGVLIILPATDLKAI